MKQGETKRNTRLKQAKLGHMRRSKGAKAKVPPKWVTRPTHLLWWIKKSRPTFALPKALCFAVHGRPSPLRSLFSFGCQVVRLFPLAIFNPKVETLNPVHSPPSLSLAPLR